MVRHYCDCCEKELTERKWRIPFMVHIFDEDNFGGYIDKDWNSISGREEEIDTCPACYNRIMGTAKEEMNKIKEENKIS